MKNMFDLLIALQKRLGGNVLVDVRADEHYQCLIFHLRKIVGGKIVAQDIPISTNVLEAMQGELVETTIKTLLNSEVWS